MPLPRSQGIAREDPQVRIIARGSRVAVAVGVTLAGALVLGPRAAPAQDLTGTFVWDATTQNNAAEAVEAATADLNFLHRRFARAHLQRTIQPHRSITIGQDQTTTSIAVDGEAPIRAPKGGEPVEWTRGDGKRMRASILAEDGEILQTLVAEDEEWEYRLRMSADGQALMLIATIRVDHLPEPIRYELLYRRER